MAWDATHITQTIHCAPSTVAEFAGNPENLPLWAAGLSAGIRFEDGKWVTDSPMGAVSVAFTGPIEHGILDHDVTLPDGSVVYNPLRVLRNDNVSEVVFTLYRHPGVTDEAFEQDAAMIVADLERLQALLEAG